MAKRRAIALAITFLGAVALALAGSLVHLKSVQAQRGAIRVASRERLVAGQNEGEVLIGDQVVLRIRAAAGGLTAAQRSERVSQRLQQLLSDERVTPADFRVARIDGDWAVMAGNELIITADTYHAALNGTTPRNLATSWRNNLASAVGTAVAGYRGEQENTASKILPIVSIGSGVRVGAARVSGPASQVDNANVVGQVETTFQDVVRIRIFVPLGNITRLERIPQVSVNAYADIRL